MRLSKDELIKKAQDKLDKFDNAKFDEQGQQAPVCFICQSPLTNIVEAAIQCTCNDNCETITGLVVGECTQEDCSFAHVSGFTLTTREFELTCQMFKFRKEQYEQAMQEKKRMHQRHYDN
jgi:hypothetical protein